MMPLRTCYRHIWFSILLFMILIYGNNGKHEDMPDAPCIDTRINVINRDNEFVMKNVLCSYANNTIIPTCLSMTWRNAVNHCIIQGGQLLTVKDDTITTLKKQLHGFNTCQKFWLSDTEKQKDSGDKRNENQTELNANTTITIPTVHARELLHTTPIKAGNTTTELVKHDKKEDENVDLIPSWLFYMILACLRDILTSIVVFWVPMIMFIRSYPVLNLFENISKRARMELQQVITGERDKELSGCDNIRVPMNMLGERESARNSQDSQETELLLQGETDQVPLMESGVEDQLRCILCRVRSRNVLFKPCQQLICCNKCSENIKHCPTCGKAIKLRILVLQEI